MTSDKAAGSQETLETGARTGSETEPGEAPGFDARLARLEAIVVQLEQGGLELEPAIERYQEGVALLKGCRDMLGKYRRQVEELSRDAEASLAAFDGDPDAGTRE